MTFRRNGKRRGMEKEGKVRGEKRAKSGGGEGIANDCKWGMGEPLAEREGRRRKDRRRN